MPTIPLRTTIGKRLIRKTSLLALLLSIIFSALHLGIEYQRGMGHLKMAVESLEEAHVKPLTQALWSFDRQQIAMQLHEFESYPFITHVAIYSNDTLVHEIGVRGRPGVEVRTVPLEAEYKGRKVPIGTFTMEIDHSIVLRRTLPSALLILGFQTVVIAAAAFFILKLFNGEVTRHLVSVSSYCSSLDISAMANPLTLDKEERGDEIDALVDAFNRMRDSLSAAYHQLNQAQKLEAIGRLAGGVAHDYNNKLTVILGYAQLLRRGLVPEEEAAEYLDEIIRAAERSRDITGQLLTFSRSQMVNPGRVDLNRVIELSLRPLKRLIGEDIRIEVIQGEDLWPVLIDPTQADQLIMNLVLNARDAIAGNGTITITTGNVVLDESACRRNPALGPGDHVRLTVGDNGCGMSPETLEHIFEPFFTTKELGKGTGLGLATVYGIVRQNGGAIVVESEPGKGSTFSVYLPRFTGGEEEPAPAGVIHPPPAVHSGTVLVVDDDEGIRHITADMLRAFGFEVLVAAGADEALEICRRPSFSLDILLTDVIMPNMNAGELIPLVRGYHPSVRVLCMSGYPDDVIARRGMVADGVPVLRKPFSPDLLRSSISRLMGEASQG